MAAHGAARQCRLDRDLIHQGLGPTHRGQGPARIPRTRRTPRAHLARIPAQGLGLTPARARRSDIASPDAARTPAPDLRPAARRLSRGSLSPRSLNPSPKPTCKRSSRSLAKCPKLYWSEHLVERKSLYQLLFTRDGPLCDCPLWMTLMIL